MEWTTHALSGAALGYMISNDWKFALVSGITAVLPDLDEPKSKFGKPFFFISIPLNQLVGHRTFTHSVLFIAIVGLLSLIISPFLSISAMVGILVHILGDMLTGQVQLIYPLDKKIGIKVSRFSYLLIDRVTRIAALLFIIFVAYQDVIQRI